MPGGQDGKSIELSSAGPGHKVEEVEGPEVAKEVFDLHQ